MPAAGSNKNKNNKRTTKARNEFSQSMPPDRPVRHDATSNNNNRREGNPHINTHTHTHTWAGNVQACVHARLYIGGNYSALATGRRRRRRIVNDNNAHWANESLTPRDALLCVCVWDCVCECCLRSRVGTLSILIAGVARCCGCCCCCWPPVAAKAKGENCT